MGELVPDDNDEADLTIDLTRQDFEEYIINPQIAYSKRLLAECLNEPENQKYLYKVDRVELLGDTSRIPKITQEIFKIFQAKFPNIESLSRRFNKSCDFKLSS